MRTVMSTMSPSNVGKLPPIPCNGWCYTEAEEDIVYDYAWTIERFSRHAVNFRTGNITFLCQGSYLHSVLQARPCILTSSLFRSMES